MAKLHPVKKIPAPDGDAVLEFLDGLFYVGRCSRYGFRRHCVLHRSHYEEELRRAAPDEAVRRGRALRLSGRRAEAEREYDRALAKDPLDAAAHAWRWELRTADASRLKRDFTAGIDRAVSLEPRRAQWRVMRALGLLAGTEREFNANPGPVLKDIDAALALEPDLFLAHIAAMHAHERLGQFARARRAAERAVRLDPRGWLYGNLGKLRLKLGDEKGYVADCERQMLLDEGAGTFREALGEKSADLRVLAKAADGFLKRRPRAYWMYVFRGDCRRSPEVNDFSGAMSDFEEAVSIRPDCSWAWAYLSRAHLTGGAGSKAVEAIERAVSLQESCGWHHVWRGEVKRRLGDFKGALPDFNEGLRLDFEYEFGYAWRGGVKRQLGRPAPALADLEIAAGLDPTYAWTMHEKSLALRDLGRVGEALGALEAACRLDPKYSWCSRPADFARATAELDAELSRDPKNAWAYAWRADIKIRIKDYRGAEKDLRKALALKPELAWARSWMARALDSLGKPKLALRELDQAVRLDDRYANSFAWRGRLRHQGGALRQALSDLKRAADLDPKSAWILEWKAETEMNLGRWKAAKEDLTRAIELDRRNFDAYRARAEVQLKLGDKEAAGADLDAALAMRPEDERVRAMARRLSGGEESRLKEAEGLSRQGLHAEAAAVCDQVLARDPASQDALRRRAEAFRCLGRYDRYVADWDAIVELRRGDASSLLSRGVARRTALDFEGALADAESSLRKKGGDLGSCEILRSEALRNLGRFETAAAAAGRAIAADPGLAWAYVVRAKAERQSGRLDAALEDTAKAARLAPRDAKAMAWRGDILRKLGRPAEALKALEKAVALEPTCAWAIALRGEVRRELGDRRKGLADVAQAVRIDGNCSCAYDILGAEPAAVREDPKYAWIYAWRGGIHRRQELWDKALADLDRAVALDPACFWARAWRGELRLARGDRSGALRDLEAALRACPDYVEALTWRGRALCESGRCAEARKAFACALSLDPSHVWALIGQGVCLERAGAAAKARACLERAKALAPALFASAA